MRGIFVTDWYTIRRYDLYYSVEKRGTKDRVKIFGQNKRNIKISTYSYLVSNYGVHASIGKKYLKSN